MDAVEAIINSLKEVLTLHMQWSMGSIVNISINRLTDEALNRIPYQSQAINGLKARVRLSIRACALSFGIAVKFSGDRGYFIRFSNNSEQWRMIMGDYLKCIEEDLRRRLSKPPED